MSELSIPKNDIPNMVVQLMYIGKYSSTKNYATVGRDAMDLFPNEQNFDLDKV